MGKGSSAGSELRLGATVGDAEAEGVGDGDVGVAVGAGDEADGRALSEAIPLVDETCWAQPLRAMTMIAPASRDGRIRDTP